MSLLIFLWPENFLCKYSSPVLWELCPFSSLRYFPRGYNSHSVAAVQTLLCSAASVCPVTASVVCSLLEEGRLTEVAEAQRTSHSTLVLPSAMPAPTPRSCARCLKVSIELQCISEAWQPHQLPQALAGLCHHAEVHACSAITTAADLPQRWRVCAQFPRDELWGHMPLFIAPSWVMASCDSPKG